MQTVIYRMDKQQGPSVQHRDTKYSVVNHNRKHFKIMYTYVQQSLYCTAGTNTAL